jgi:hypothetical protein
MRYMIDRATGTFLASVVLALAAAFAMPGSAFAQPATAGAFNIKLLNNNQPDFSDARSFGRSCSYGWTTDQEKAISMWKWTCLNRVQTDVSISEIFERGIKPQYFGVDNAYQTEPDFVTYLNSIPNQFCGYICPAFGACWELYTGQFHATNNIVIHTTVDVWYDGKPHMFDTSLNNYVLNDAGAVAGALELQQNFKTDQGKWWISANCPMRAADSYTSVLLYDGRTLKEFGSKYDVVNQTRGGGEAVNQVALAIRPYTSYKRYKDPLDPKDENYFIPSRGDGDKQTYEGQGGGKFPNSYWGNNYSVTNGEWIIEPNFTKKDWQGCALSVENITQDAAGAIHPAAGQDASVTFNITPYNSVANMQISAKALKGEKDTLDALISYDAGKSWTALEASINGDFSKLYRKEVLAKKAYMLKFHLKAASDPKSVALQSLKIRVVTQVNRMSFFQLDRGNNKVYINLGEQLDRVEFRPDYRPEQAMSYMHESSNLKPGAGPMRNNVELKTQGQAGYAVYKIDAPGDIKRVTIAGVFGVWDANCPMSLQYSTDLGKTWTKFTGGDIPLSDAFIGEKAPKSPDDIGNAQYAQKFCSDTISAAGVKTVLFKVQWSPTAGPKAYSNGLWRVWMAADYQPAAFTPFDVTLSWQEFRRDGSAPVRTFRKTVTKADPWTVLDVNVAGYRPPLMKYATVSAAGCNPDNVKEGYSDGVDVGAADEQAKFVYATKNNLAKGRPVTASVMPEDKEKGLARLVDEYVTQNFFKTGCRWGKGQNPEITIALDGEQEIHGVAVHQNIDADCAKGTTASSYADSIEVSVSTDQATWTKAGTITKYDLFNWPGDYLPLGFEAMHFAPKFLGGVINYNCPLAFDKPLRGKFVKFTVTNASDMWAVTELRVWGEMKKTPWKHDNFEHDKMGK